MQSVLIFWRIVYNDALPVLLPISVVIMVTIVLLIVVVG